LGKVRKKLETIEVREQRTIKTIKEKEKEIRQENLELREWIEEDNDKMGNICDPYYEL